MNFKLSIIPGRLTVFTLVIIFFIMAYVVLSFSAEQGCPGIYCIIKYFLSRINPSYEKGSSMTITSYNHDISKFLPYGSAS